MPRRALARAPETPLHASYNRKVEQQRCSVLVIMGVSGSGKTTVGASLAATLHWHFADADVWHSTANIDKMRHGIALTDADRLPWLASLNAAIAGWVTSAIPTVLACSALKDSYRELLTRGTSEGAVRFVFLKANASLIASRLHTRMGHYMPESLMKSQFDDLEEPMSSEALVVDAGLPVARLVQQIQARL